MRLVKAVQNNDVSAIRSLLDETDGSPKNKPLEMFTAMTIAVGESNLGIVKMLLPYVDINNLRRVNGETFLHIAVGVLHRRSIEYLLDHGADINSHDDRGATPLHVSIDSELMAAMDLSERLNCLVPACASVTALLIARGANINAKMADGTTPLDLALDGHKAAEQLLREYGAVSGTGKDK